MKYIIKNLIILLSILLLPIFILSACNNKSVQTPLGKDALDNDKVETANEIIVEPNTNEIALPFGAEGIHFEEMENANVNEPEVAAHIENAPPFSE